MANLHPVYSEGDLQGLSHKKRQELSEAILRVVQTNEEVRKILRDETLVTLNRLKAEP
jgi:hypothetical protein